MRVLLVEDDAELSAVVAAGLGEHHIETVVAGDARAGRARALSGTYDVMVLDIMLPGGSGVELCGAIRASASRTPILMLTARDGIDDRVRGLDAGADDYLTKPFAFRELLARIRALARRPPAFQPEHYQTADLVVELTSRHVERAGRAIDLTAREFALLECFVRHPGVVLGRAAITAHVWDENHDPYTNVLEVLVRRLRRKIDDDFEPKLIHTVRGAGYRFGT